MRVLILIFTLMSIGNASAALNIKEEVALEEKTIFYEKAIELQVRVDMIQASKFWNENKELNSMAFVDILWKKGWDSPKSSDHELVRQTLTKLNHNDFDLTDKLRLFLLDEKLGKNIAFNSEFMSELFNKAISGDLQRREIFTLLNYQASLESFGFEDIFVEVDKKYREDLNYYEAAKNSNKEVLSKEEVQNLVFHDLDLDDFSRGKYSSKPKIYMLCRHDRNFPCMMVMRDSKNELVKNEDGSVWMQSALGLARRGRAYNVKNGYTPAGVYTIDSVMPEANRRTVFGKYRRLILNFISKSTDERTTKKLLPKSAESSLWWNQAVVARDVGRNLLRIHGTGLRNNNPQSSYYPFVPTSGCIAQKENTYGGVKHKGQRQLLDVMMEASDLKVKYKNEAKLKGLLYVVEVDSAKKAMTRADVEDLLNL
jgi:hypothetical protein